MSKIEWIKPSHDMRSLKDKFNDAGGGYVYLALRWDGLFKIGAAIEPLNRMKTLRAHHGRVELIFKRWFSDPLQIEHDMHDLFKSQRIEREIFDFNLNELRDFYRLINPLHPDSALPSGVARFETPDGIATVVLVANTVFVTSPKEKDVAAFNTRLLPSEFNPMGIFRSLALGD